MSAGALNARAPVRFRIIALLFVVCFVNFLLRNNLSVALPSLRAEYGFTATQLGWIIGSFNLAYALFQFPGGLFGQWLGARRALTIAALAWGVLTLLTPLTAVSSAAVTMGGLIVVRFLMGVSHAALFPTVPAVIARWFPVGGWAFPNALLSAGLSLGQAAIGPVMSVLIVWFGWRMAFIAVAPLGVLVGLWWWWYGRDTPEEHAAVTPQEIAEIKSGRVPARPTEESPVKLRSILANRDVILLACSYFCMNYVFFMFAQWLFTYLIEERGFSLLESGVMYMLPFVVGAIMAAVGGLVCDRLCRDLGPRRGCRFVAGTGLLLVAFFLVLGVRAANPYIAVALLALCFGFTQFTEGAFWSGCTFAAGTHTAAASGLVNTGGNLPGFLAPLIGAMVDRLGWVPTLASGSFFAILGAALWVFINLDGANESTHVESGREGSEVYPAIAAGVAVRSADKPDG